MIFEMNETVKQNEKLLKSNKLSEVVEYKSSLKEYGDRTQYKIWGFQSHAETVTAVTSLTAYISYLTKTIGHIKDKVTVIATISSDYKPIWGVACVGETEAWIYGNKQTIISMPYTGMLKTQSPLHVKTDLVTSHLPKREI